MYRLQQSFRGRTDGKTSSLRQRFGGGGTIKSTRSVIYARESALIRAVKKRMSSARCKHLYTITAVVCIVFTRFAEFIERVTIILVSVKMVW